MISTIILTLNSEKYIENCLRALFSDIRTSREKVEVLVVDGGSKDCTLEILDELEREYSSLRSIRMGINKGTAMSRNIGIKESSGDFIFILDSDTEVQPGTLDTLTKTLQNEEKVGIGGPRLFSPNSSIQPSCKKFPTLKIKLFKFLPCKKTRSIALKKELYPKKVYTDNFKQMIEVDHCVSACWMVRREAIDEIGLLDENIFFAPEDVDYCVRMWLNGWKVLYNPQATVMHHIQRKTYSDPRVFLHHLWGLFHYFRKYGYWLDREKIYSQIKNKDYTIPV